MNIDPLLKPISPERPSGDDLRYTEVYDHIKEARRCDDQLELGEWRTNVKTSDWRQVVKLCGDVLTERTKDLQIAVWLTEAWVSLYGYGGLAAGLDLTHRLLNDFWPSLYPLVEENDMEYRIGPLMLLNEKLPEVIFRVPLCNPDLSKGYNYHQWKESRVVGFGQNLDKEQKKRREALIAEGKVSGEDFAAAVNAGSLAYYQKLTRQLTHCRQALQTLDAIVTEKFAPNPPGFGRLLGAIDACAHIAGRIRTEKRKNEIAPSEESEPTASAGGSSAVLPAAPERETEDAAIANLPSTQVHAICDISAYEKGLWKQVSEKAEKGCLKDAMDQLLSAAALSPSIREKNRYLLLLAKLCLKAERADLAGPIVEELYKRIETLHLEKWEHPAWIAEVVETLFRCLSAANQAETERAKTLFQKLCMLDVTKAAAYRIGA
ncbi:MAG: type VI secretion system protein TssA [Desulfatitalea sp.]